MNIHKNARLTPLRREEMALSVIEGRLLKADAVRVYGVSARIVSRWVERYKAEGPAGMADRSSRPEAMPRATDAAAVSAGSLSMSASTTPHASPSARSCPTRKRKAPSPSCWLLWPITKASGWPSPVS